MRRFLLQSLAFIVMIIVVISIATALLNTKTKSTFRLAPNIHTIFLGNSHIECSINDSIIPNSFNFARSGERMEWVYSKLKLLLSENSQIDTVFIGFDNVLCFKDAKTEDVHMGHFSPFFLQTLDMSDYKAILYDTSCKYKFDMFTKAMNISKLYEIYREGGKGAENLSLGGFVPSHRNKLKEDIQRRKQAKKTTNKQPNIDALSKYFLDKSIKLCKEKGITVIFLVAPQHPITHNDKQFYKYFANKYYPDIKMMDYKKLILPDSAFQDLDHLSYIGADIFSEFLKKELSNNPQ